MLWCAHSLVGAVQVSRNIEVLRFLESKGVPFIGHGDYDVFEYLHGKGTSCVEHVKFLLEGKLGTLTEGGLDNGNTEQDR